MKNTVIDTIYNRRSVRKYKSTPIDKTTIEELIDAGRMAPSAINGQPWRFYVVTDKTLITQMDREIREIAKRVFKVEGASEFLDAPNPIFHGAPVVLFITAPKDRNEWNGLDIGMCSQNIMLASHSLGLSTCPIGLGTLVTQTPFLSSLSIPSSESVMLAISLGYGDESPAVHERKKDNVFYVETKA